MKKEEIILLIKLIGFGALFVIMAVLLFMNYLFIMEKNICNELEEKGFIVEFPRQKFTFSDQNQCNVLMEGGTLVSGSIFKSNYLPLLEKPMGYGK